MKPEKDMKYTREQMSSLLVGAHNHYMTQVPDHPALEAVCKALKKAVDKVKEIPEPTTTQITIKDNEITLGNVKGVSFWALKFGLDEVKGEETGRVHDNPGKPYHGKPVFKGAYDRKRKLNVIPLEKKAELLALLKGFDVDVEVVRA